MIEAPGQHRWVRETLDTLLRREALEGKPSPPVWDSRESAMLSFAAEHTVYGLATSGCDGRRIAAYRAAVADPRGRHDALRPEIDPTDTPVAKILGKYSHSA